MTIVRRILASAAFAAVALAQPASAQEQQSEPETDIVVTGQIPLSEEQARDAVRSVSQPVGGQLARFHDRVCPLVVGFDAPYEAMVAERIRTTARRVGARVAGEGCEANLFVVIVDDGPAFVREVSHRDGGALASLPKREFEELTSADGAARSWSTTLLTNSVGTAAGRPSPSAGGGSVKTGFAGSSVSFGDVDVLRVYDASNANPSVQQTIRSSWVVLETEATFGKSLRQIADYAAMRGLALVRPAELDHSVETILDLFEPDSSGAPSELSAFDTAYLTGLYRAPTLRSARSQVGYIADAVASEAEERAP